jgi:hypothetical protein
MRIAFVTGSLAAGRDGVGDYSRDLAGACTRAGHTAVLVALNDPHTGSQHGEIQTSRGTDLEVLRLPASRDWRSRITTARNWLAGRDIDCISLQFVPYGFHPKGLVGSLGTELAPLCAGRRLHVMFHELWIGAPRHASLRHRAVGWLQRRAILRLLRVLRPHRVHTSNPAYRALLDAVGVEAGVLPLCGSIPVAPPNPQWLPRELLQAGVPASAINDRSGTWVFGLFGSLHPEWNPEPLFAQVAAQAAGRQVIITAIGRQGGGTQLWQELQRKHGRRFSFCALGERSTAEISWYLQSLDFGIATTPWLLIGKSATAAAMIDHGLPVIVTRDDVRFGVTAEGADPVHPLLFRIATQTHWPRVARGAPEDRLPRMAAQFLADVAGVSVNESPGAREIRQ